MYWRQKRRHLRYWYIPMLNLILVPLGPVERAIVCEVDDGFSYRIEDILKVSVRCILELSSA